MEPRSSNDTFAEYFADDSFDIFCIKQELRIIDKLDSIKRLFNPEDATYPPQYDIEVRE